MMVHTKNEALMKINETIELLDKAQFNLACISKCWEKLDSDDVEKLKCRNFSIITSRIIENLKMIK